MKPGNVIQFTVDRIKYHLSPSISPNYDIFVGFILRIAKNGNIDIKCLDINGDGSIKYLTIPKEAVVKIL